MTKSERLESFQGRLNGESWAQIASRLGYTAEAVRSDLLHCVRDGVKPPNIKYPRLREIVVEEYHGSLSAFAEACGLSLSTMRYSLVGQGRGNATKPVIDAVLRVTGLSYEEAFRL